MAVPKENFNCGFLARLRSLSAAPFSYPPRQCAITSSLSLSFQSYVVSSFPKPLILSYKTRSLRIPENLLSRIPPYLPCLPLGESSLAVVPLNDIVSFPALIWVFMTCFISSVIELGVVTYVCLGPISAVALTGLHAVIVAWGAYSSPLLSIFFPATLFGSELASASLFVEPLPRGVSEVSGRCPC